MEDVGGELVSSSRPRPSRGKKVCFTLGNKRRSTGRKYQDVLSPSRDGSTHSDQPKAKAVTYLIRAT